MTQLEKRSFEYQKKESSCGVNTEFDADESWDGSERDVVSSAEPFDRVNNEFLNFTSRTAAISSSAPRAHAGQAFKRTGSVANLL